MQAVTEAFGSSLRIQNVSRSIASSRAKACQTLDFMILLRTSDGIG